MDNDGGKEDDGGDRKDEEGKKGMKGWIENVTTRSRTMMASELEICDTKKGNWEASRWRWRKALRKEKGDPQS